MTPGISTRTGIVGKVPWREEYLRINASGEPFASFDAWLTDNMEWAAARAGNDWPQAYRAGGTYAFALFSLGAGSVHSALVGTLCPSFDRAGRNFPLSVVAALENASELFSAPEALPVVLEGFWQTASQLVVAAQSEGGTDLVEQLEAVRIDPGLVVPDALRSYADWSRTLPLAELWELVCGESGLSAGANAVRMIAEAVKPYRGVERPKTRLSLRLPLGRAGGAAVCFWIDLVRRMARWRATAPGFFWSHDGSSGDMLLHLGFPPRSTLAELWMPTGRRDEFFDLTVPSRSDQVETAAGAPSRPSGLSATEGGTVMQLLNAAESLEP